MSGYLTVKNSATILQGVLTGARRRTRCTARRFTLLLGRQEGASVIEFALFSPLLAAGLLSLGLFGVQINNYIKMDQILRAGAAYAMTDPGNDAFIQRLEDIARSKGYTAVNTEEGNIPGVLHVQGGRNCFCPGDETDLGCLLPCEGRRPAVVRYFLIADYREPIAYDFMQALIRISPDFAVRAMSDIELHRQVVVR
ncbi:hypothetical protein [Microvirga sp. M2]|uniref:hypothetical protein n=1 Tax=Microvirga sp. M2 TaxID=3073270 RepID=UPI0039C0877E